MIVVENEFLLQQKIEMEDGLAKMAAKLREFPDPTDPAYQKLDRLYNQKMRCYLAVCNTLHKTDSAEPDEMVEIPDSWRGDPVLFAQEALHVALYDHQKEFCRSDCRVNLLIAGRGAGKSLAACVIAIHQAACNPRHTVLIVSSGQRMSSDFGSKIIDLLRESQVRVGVKKISNEQVSFKNRSVVKLLPANADTIRGYHPKAASRNAGISVILDEACFMEQGDEIRKAVEYALITTPKDKGRLYIVSSPSTTGSWVYAYAQKANDPDADTAVVQCPSAANPAITPEEIERLRKTKNELEFRAEVLGEWVDGAYGLFSGLIEPNRKGAVGDPIPDEAVCALGADLALSYDAAHDRNALAVVASWWPDGAMENLEIEPRRRLVEMVILDRASDLELRRTVGRLVETYGIVAAAVEVYQGKGLSEYCQSLKVQTELIAPTSGAQQAAFHELHRLLRQNLLELPDGLPPVFFEEMAAFEYRRESNGRISFGGPSSVHDDTVYALAWAIQSAQTAINLPRQHDSSAPLIAFIPQRK